MTAAVVGTLIVLYFGGLQGKIQSSVVAFSERLRDLVVFNLDTKDFNGLGKAFGEYRRLNSELSEAALIVNNTAEIATNPAAINKPWAPSSSDYEFKVDLSRADQPRHVAIGATVPESVLLERVARSVKNFAALFIASAFLAGLFLQVALSLQSARRSSAAVAEARNSIPAGDSALVILKPIFFLAVFLDSMTYSFLPKFMQEAAAASGMSVSFAAVPFTAYYLFFVASLIPASNFADRYGPNPIILTGLLLAGASVFGLCMPVGIAGMTALRALSGVGQGMLLIGVQNYILAAASPEKKTQGTAIIVLGFQGGMLSGMAIGSLLVNFVGHEGIFAISGVVGVATAIYTFVLLPRLAECKQVTSGMKAAMQRLGTDLKNVVTDGDFLKTMFCIGIPAKAILTGVITFALPLVLTQQHYRAEDVGQIIMLYGLAVVVATGYVSRLVDRTRNTESILFWGAIMSGFGLIMVGLMGSRLLGDGLLGTSVVVGGVILVGVAHGFINAPVVTHVGQSILANRIGASPVTTTYRFLERGGHIAGPFVVSQLFLMWGQGPHVVAGIGLVTAAVGLFFVAHRFGPWVRPMQSEPV
jgi:MFS family permease